ncbi:MAG: UvrD-helicase domain-containing protein, partial [Planctomycetaceae bacterium]|nr:UvrD-helicase domain-containing protein [Planctomycetaceae bacterium]
MSHNTTHFNYLLDGLTESQREAVCHKDGAMLVVAGPGSGKTRVVTHRVAALLAQGVWSSQILALTFTNKAADEMKNRVNSLVPNQRVWIGTFHKFCAVVLRQYGSHVGLSDRFSIY